MRNSYIFIMYSCAISFYFTEKHDFFVKEKIGDESTTPRWRKPEALRRMKTLTKAEKIEALQRATSGFKSQNPVFMVVIQPYHVFDRYRMVSFRLKFW